MKPPLVWFTFRAAVTTDSAPSSLRAQETVPASTRMSSFTPANGHFPPSSLLNTSVHHGFPPTLPARRLGLGRDKRKERSQRNEIQRSLCRWVRPASPVLGARRG